jgi:hypothetical protein
LKDFDKYLFANCPDIGLVQEIANGTKHFGSDRNEIKDTRKKGGYAGGLLLILTQSHLVIEATSKTHIAKVLFKTVVEQWEKFFADQGIP